MFTGEQIVFNFVDLLSAHNLCDGLSCTPKKLCCVLKWTFVKCRTNIKVHWLGNRGNFSFFCCTRSHCYLDGLPLPRSFLRFEFFQVLKILQEFCYFGRGPQNVAQKVFKNTNRAALIVFRRIKIFRRSKSGTQKNLKHHQAGQQIQLFDFLNTTSVRIILRITVIYKIVI